MTNHAKPLLDGSRRAAASAVPLSAVDVSRVTELAQEIIGTLNRSPAPPPPPPPTGMNGEGETRPSMEALKILEWARAIIYAAATGLIVHILGTILHNERGLPIGQAILNSSLAALAVLFIIIDGIARHCVRHSDEPPPAPVPGLRALRFILEVAGIFFFSYWTCLIIISGHPIIEHGINEEGKPFLALFAICCFIQNLIGLMVILMKRHPSFISIWNLYGCAWVTAYYFSSVLWRDVMEIRVQGKKSEALVSHITLLKKDLSVLHSQISKDPESSFPQYLKASVIRVRAQTKWIHIGLMHLVGFVLFMPEPWVSHTYPAWIPAIIDFSPLPWLLQGLVSPSSLLIFAGVAFGAYYATSNFEHRRYQRSVSPATPDAATVAAGISLELLPSGTLDDAGRRERWSQGIGNLSLLAVYAVGLAYFPIEIFYVFYFLSMARANAVVLFQSHNSHPIR